MDDTMKEDDKKKKKGMAIVIAVTPHAPKKPVKMKNATPTGQVVS